VEKLITTNLSELKKLNLSVSPKPSVEFAVEEERKYRAEWERFSDSLSLIRVMKRIPIEKAILEESELNLANQIESLTESIKVPEFLEEHKSEILVKSPLQNSVTWSTFPTNSQTSLPKKKTLSPWHTTTLTRVQSAKPQRFVPCSHHVVTCFAWTAYPNGFTSSPLSVNVQYAEHH
jgi:hypothetical protein